MKINLMPPALIFHADRGVPDHGIAVARGPVVIIRPKWRGNAGVMAHEVEHARQFWATLGAHVFLYSRSRRYRAWSEARAYAAQIDATDEAHWTVDYAARLMALGYDLGLKQDKCAEMIRRYKAIP